MYTRFEFYTMDEQASVEGAGLLHKADFLRVNGKPEKWARDVERKALRKFEHSFVLRHMFDRKYQARPEVLPPSSYSHDAR